MIIYEESQSIEIHGNYSKVKKYLDEYKIKENRNGYWLLIKPAKAILTINGKHYNVKNYILEHYNKKRISKNLVDKLENDIINGKISIDEILNNI